MKLLICLIASVIAIADAQAALEIKGTAKFQVRGDFNTVEWVDVFYIVLLDGCQWKIRFSSHRFADTDYYEVACDGTNTYYLSSIERWFNGQKAAGKIVGKDISDNVGIACVRQSKVPAFPFAHWASPIWLSFCSGCYFDGLGNSRAEPPAVIHAFSRGDRNPNSYLLQSVSVVSFTNELHVPSSVVYLPDEKSLLNRSVFTMISATNVNGKFFPNATSFETFFPDLENPNKMQVVSYRVEATNIMSINTPPDNDNFRPKLPGIVSVAEERFNRAGTSEPGNLGFHFTYKTTKWLSDEEVKNLPEFKRQRISSHAPPPAKSKAVVAFFFVLMTIIIPLLAWKVFFPQRDNQPTATSSNEK